MILGAVERAYSSDTHGPPGRETAEDIAREYLRSGGDGLMDVASPLNSRSLWRQDRAQIGELDGAYVCVNPDNRREDYGNLHRRPADGLSRSEAYDSQTGIDDVAGELGLDDPLYMVVKGLPHLLTHHPGEFGHIPTDTPWPERAEETATTLARNLSDMATDDLLIVATVLEDQDTHTVRGNHMPGGLFTYVTDELEDNDWSITVKDARQPYVLAGEQS